MPLEYNPKDAVKAWPEALYAAELTDVVDSVSKTGGKPMEVWTFTAYDDANNRQQIITEYVTASAAFKIKQLAGALRQAADFEAGRFHAEAYIGARVMVYLKVEEETSDFPAKNRVQRISAVPPQSAPAAAHPSARPAPVRQTVPASTDLPPDDNIPF